MNRFQPRARSLIFVNILLLHDMRICFEITLFETGGQSCNVLLFYFNIENQKNI